MRQKHDSGGQKHDLGGQHKHDSGSLNTHDLGGQPGQAALDRSTGSPEQKHDSDGQPGTDNNPALKITRH